jgi:hypothetical protein
MTSSVRGAFFLAAILTIIPVRLGGQEQNLLPHSSPDVLALYKAHSAFINLGSPFDPLKISEISSPDSATLKILDQAESSYWALRRRRRQFLLATRTGQRLRREL